MGKFIDVQVVKELIVKGNYQDMFFLAMLEEFTKELVFDGEKVFNETTGELLELEIENDNEKSLTLKGSTSENGVKYLHIWSGWNDQVVVQLQSIKDDDLYCIILVGERPMSFENFGLKNSEEYENKKYRSGIKVMRYIDDYYENTSSYEFIEITMYKNVVNLLSKEGLFPNENLISGHDYTSVYTNPNQREIKKMPNAEELIWPTKRTEFDIASQISLEKPRVEVPKNIFDIEKGIKVLYEYDKKIKIIKGDVNYDEKILDIPCRDYEYAVNTLKYLVPKELQKMSAPEKSTSYSKKLTTK